MMTFLGYRRADGRVGTRNHVLVLSVTGLTGPSARRIAASVKGAVFAGTPYGSGLLGEDRAIHERALAGLAAHPNAGAVLVIGADEPLVESVAAAVPEGIPVEALAFDRCGHDALRLVDTGVRHAARMAWRLSRARREEAPLSSLVLGLECGRSDPSSGLVANPTIGRVADRVVAAGGTAILGETVEWLGAEDRIAARAADPALGEALVAAVLRREAAAVAAGIDLTGTNPSRTNIDGGLTTIEEKSLGAVAKSGQSPIAGLVGYGEPPRASGLHLMDAPAYAPESLTGFVAAGANLILFATGVGNSYGAPLAPTLKVTGNPDTAARLTEQIDVDLSPAFEGKETPEDAADRLLAAAIATASGAATFAEIFGDGDEVISRFGAAL
ncbi:UxaA family hydrolase [Acuticoccus sp. M5D2P5]|uniref:UxaA family hydrolase n=1 Tax=Acuticoccus kalidii TaxID=2910977 RepID=UPI001F48F45F|nr:UxaA family hydrolase [Acuticoccus kalidii]MCF3936681.1 UxaA family hydrolase [Acuticoccus kalidii]